MIGSEFARDAVWSGIAAVFAVLTVRYTWQIAALLLEAPTVADALPLAVVGIVVVTAGVWLTLGALRRTRWGRRERS